MLEHVEFTREADVSDVKGCRSGELGRWADRYTSTFDSQ